MSKFEVGQEVWVVKIEFWGYSVHARQIVKVSNQFGEVVVNLDDLSVWSENEVFPTESEALIEQGKRLRQALQENFLRLAEVDPSAVIEETAFPLNGATAGGVNVNDGDWLYWIDYEPKMSGFGSAADAAKALIENLNGVQS